MKKALTIILALCMICVLCLTACKSEKTDLLDKGENSGVSDKNEDKQPEEPKDAVSLYKLIDDKMVSLDSYETEQKMRFLYYIYGTKIESEAEAKLISLLNDEESPYYYQYYMGEFKTDDEALNQKTLSFTGYKDGKMYLMNDNGNPTQKLCAVTDKAVFEEYIDESGIRDLDLVDCKDSTFEKKEDGSWLLGFSGYTKKSINKLMDELGLDELEEFLDILDMKVTMEADSQYRAVSVKIEFVFDVEEGSTEIPEMIIVQNYSKYGEVDRNSVEFDTEGYTEVADLMILDELSEKIEELYELENGKFTLNINQLFKSNGITVSEHNEKDMVFYGKEDGGYFFSLDGEINQVKMSVKYKNGLMVTTAGEESQSQTVTDSQAKDVVNALIDSVKFNPELVSNIEKISDDEYKFEIRYADKSFYEEMFAQMGVTDRGAKQTISISLENGKITKIVGELEVLGEVVEGSVSAQIEMKLVSENVFEYQAGGEISA